MHTFIWSWAEWCTTSQLAPRFWGSKHGDSVFTLSFSTYLHSLSRPWEQARPWETTSRKARFSEVSKRYSSHTHGDHGSNFSRSACIYERRGPPAVLHLLFRRPSNLLPASNEARYSRNGPKSSAPPALHPLCRSDPYNCTRHSSRTEFPP